MQLPASCRQVVASSCALLLLANGCRILLAHRTGNLWGPSGEVARGDGDGRADADHVDGDADERNLKRKGAVGEAGERQYDELHEPVDGDAIEGSGERGAAREEPEEMRGEDVDGSGSGGDEEFKEKAKERGGPPAREGGGTKQAGGDSLQKPEGAQAHGAVDDKGGGDVEGAAKEAAAEDSE